MALHTKKIGGGGGGGGGTTVHNELTGREVTDAHPISAITGLQAELDTIPTLTSELTNDAGFITSYPVDSVNGQTGIVSLDTDDVAEGINQYDKIVSLLDGAGISVTGTYPDFTVTNISPDQVVALAAGTNVSITGTYPNFTINADGGTAPVTSVNGRDGVVVGLAEANAVVDLSTPQTVAGIKTFSDSPIVPTPTTGTQVANKAYVDANAGGGGGGGGGIMKLYNSIGTAYKSCPYVIGCLNQPTFVIANRVYYIPFCLGFNKTFTEIGLSVVTDNGGEGVLGLYTVNNGRPDDLVFTTDTITLSVGYHSKNINFDYTAGDVYMLAFLGLSTTLRGISAGAVQQILPNATAVVTQSHYWEDGMLLFGDLPTTAGTLNAGTGTVPAIYLQ